ncbi:MAG: hypothetical protein HXS48_00785 [Theionarchaea archaeon]|nr:hypothetical protein [Theionarchaea archaeon]
MSDSKSFTVKYACKCGAEFYYSFLSGDGYSIGDARNQAKEMSDGFLEIHKTCQKNEDDELPADWRV